MTTQRKGTRFGAGLARQARRWAQLVLLTALLWVAGQMTLRWAIAETHSQAATCEPWQEPDGHGGCVDRCDADHVWDDVDRVCKEKPKPCPTSTIDIQGNGRNDGGEDCQALDVMTPVNTFVHCTPGPLEMTMPSGTVTCYTTVGAGLSVRVSPGCSTISRTPYPRAMVNVPITFRETGVLPIVAETVAGGVGWYRYNSSNRWQVSGWRLDEKYGHQIADHAGASSFDMRSQLPAADLWKFPSINGVRIWLEFERVAAPFGLGMSRWEIQLQSGTGLGDTYSGNVARGDVYEIAGGFRRSSHPSELGGASADYVVPGMAPDRNGANTLPGLKVGLTTGWNLYFVATWDEYVASPGNAYEYSLSGSARVFVGTYVSHRVWDPRQPYSDEVRPIYCNTLAGFAPVPVLEGQSVLIP